MNVENITPNKENTTTQPQDSGWDELLSTETRTDEKNKLVAVDPKTKQHAEVVDLVRENKEPFIANADKVKEKIIALDTKRTTAAAGMVEVLPDVNDYRDNLVSNLPLSEKQVEGLKKNSELQEAITQYEEEVEKLDKLFGEFAEGARQAGEDAQHFLDSLGLESWSSWRGTTENGEVAEHDANLSNNILAPLIEAAKNHLKKAIVAFRNASYARAEMIIYASDDREYRKQEEENYARIITEGADFVRPISPEIVEAHEEYEHLKQQYDDCIKRANRHKSQYLRARDDLDKYHRELDKRYKGMSIE